MLTQKLESHPSGGQYVHLHTRVHKDLKYDVIKYRTMSDKQNVLLNSVCKSFQLSGRAEGTALLSFFFTAYIWFKDKANKAHRVREPLAFQDRKSGRSKK